MNDLKWRGHHEGSITTEMMKERLDWMAKHPGEWLRWGWQRFAQSSRHLKEPSFETRYVSPSVRDFAHHPDAGVKPGLWVRYMGYPYQREGASEKS